VRGKSFSRRRDRYKVTIGERRRPDPQGRPGYLRIDTVHLGDLEGIKGVYHVTAVDEVTQWQVVGATAYISEAWLMPVLEAMLRQFPFQILVFHSDNGSEFINRTVANLLNKLLVEQTKSRPRHSNEQRIGRGQERSGNQKAYGLRAHRVAACGSH
jgi:transposase InsO family protein